MPTARSARSRTATTASRSLRAVDSGIRRASGFSGCNRHGHLRDQERPVELRAARRHANGLPTLGGQLETAYLDALAHVDKTGVQMREPQQLQIVTTSGATLTFTHRLMHGAREGRPTAFAWRATRVPATSRGVNRMHAALESCSPAELGVRHARPSHSCFKACTRLSSAGSASPPSGSSFFWRLAGDAAWRCRTCRPRLDPFRARLRRGVRGELHAPLSGLDTNALGTRSRQASPTPARSARRSRWSCCSSPGCPG